MRHGRLCSAEEDRHESVEDLLHDVGDGAGGQPVGLSAVHAVPLLEFTAFPTGRRVRRVHQLPALRAGQQTLLSAADVSLLPLGRDHRDLRRGGA